jgi:YidC/Oxa1 family membrane protein insertase
MPDNPAQRVIVRKVEWPRGTAEHLTNGYETALVFPAQTLPPGGKWTQNFTFYAGPKEYNRLAKLGQKMGNNLDLVMNFGFWGFFSKFLLLSMNGLHALGLGYGLTIIAITVIIKMLFWPLTNASTRSMKRMQALQPQMKEIAEKYKDDPAKKNQKTMEFMREHKINPLGGCLPMVFQIPVFIGFYSMLRTAIELRGVTFLWACDLSRPDTIFYLGGFPVNPLPLIMGATMLWQARLTPPSPGMDPAQQKMMRYMPLMFIFILYKMSAGLTLYWTVQNLLTVLQTKLTRAGDTGKAAPPVKKK